MGTERSMVSLSHTCSDTAKPFTTNDIPFYEANFHVKDYDVYYGDGSNMGAVATAGSVIYFRNGNLKDIFFKNETTGGGAIATVNVVASVIDKETKKALGL